MGSIQLDFVGLRTRRNSATVSDVMKSDKGLRDFVLVRFPSYLVDCPTIDLSWWISYIGRIKFIVRAEIE